MKNRLVTLALVLALVSLSTFIYVVNFGTPFQGRGACEDTLAITTVPMEYHATVTGDNITVEYVDGTRLDRRNTVWLNITVGAYGKPAQTVVWMPNATDELAEGDSIS
ncbi:MAG: hypothetical protein SXQ77_03945, partial [Halobacteria archaeon]|nr:hypothetical protein [Halobacteria archaeon]